MLSMRSSFPLPLSTQLTQGPLIIPDVTTAHAHFNMQIVHTKEVVRLFREVTGVKNFFVQQIFATLDKLYLADIHNHIINSINDTVVDMLTHLQEKYG